MVSALIPSKRVEAGIEAVSRIPDAHLVVAGAGSLKNTIDAKASHLLPGRFSLHSVSPNDMPLLYQSADVFLHLSKEESFGNVFLEAMACGLPIVGHDTSRTRWLVGDDEYLVDTDDLAAVGLQIERAKQSLPGQSELRRKRAASFSWEKIAKSYQSFLEEVVDACQV
jgi:glycosyltransferase involved in cell wall biosynthesis